MHANILMRSQGEDHIKPLWNYNNLSSTSFIVFGGFAPSKDVVSHKDKHPVTGTCKNKHNERNKYKWLNK